MTNKVPEHFDSCIQDGHVYHCLFDLPVSYHSRKCAGAVYYGDHDSILKYCWFQMNPVYEDDIVQEVRPGEYLMSTGNQTWVRDCPEGTESIDRWTFCIVPLHCNCWLRTDDQYLAGTLDTCLIDDICIYLERLRKRLMIVHTQLRERVQRHLDLKYGKPLPSVKDIRHPQYYFSSPCGVLWFSVWVRHHISH